MLCRAILSRAILCLLMMAGLTLLPVKLLAQTTSDSIGLGTTWLLSARYDMGMWIFATPPNPLQEEFTVDDFTPTYVRDTLEAVEALQAVNTSITEYDPTLDWLEFTAFTSTGQLGLKIKILSKAGRNVTQAVGSLLAVRNTDGGFNGSKDYPSNVLDTAFALQALAAGSTDTTAINGSLSYLLAAQNSDGGWGFVPGQTSHVYYTAIVMQALESASGGQVQTTAIANALSRATSYLLAQQQPDGSWGNVADTALAFTAINKTTGNVAVRSAAIRYLLGQQQVNGSWSDDPYSTALALQALKAGESLDREIDNDGDGYTEVQGDCNDHDASIHPGAVDSTVDGIDQDCNGIDGPPVGSIDQDGDGYSPLQGDCDDTNPAIHPGAVDIPGNGIDENCDGHDAVAVVTIQSVSLFKVVNGIETPAIVFRPYETMAVHVTVNDPTAPLYLFVTDPAGQVLPVQAESGAYYFDTLNHISGSYTVTARVLDAQGNVLNEAQTAFAIESGVGLAGGFLGFTPLSSHVGATETVTVAAFLTNGSNADVTFTVMHNIRSPSGVTLNSGTTSVSLTPDQTLATLTLAAFSQNFTESGEYPVTAEVYSGSTKLATLTESIPVAPAIRIDPSLTITPDTILPDGDKRIRIEIRLEGLKGNP
jgi:hypothetical protein